MIELTTKLNFDAVIELALYLAFEVKLNDSMFGEQLKMQLSLIYIYTS